MLLELEGVSKAERLKLEERTVLEEVVAKFLLANDVAVCCKSACKDVLTCHILDTIIHVGHVEDIMSDPAAEEYVDVEVLPRYAVVP